MGVNAREQQLTRFREEQAGRVLYATSAHRGRAEALSRPFQGEARSLQLRRSLREQLLQVLRDELQRARAEEPDRDLLRHESRRLYAARFVRGERRRGTRRPAGETTR